MVDDDLPGDGLPRPLAPEPLVRRVQAHLEPWRNRIPWTAVAAVAVVAFAVTWWMARPRPAPIPLPDDALPVASPAPAPTPIVGRIIVHVAGAVHVPGVVTVDEGSRVTDVVESVGGFAPTADLDRVNLAGVVIDGQRLWIPRVGEDEPAISAGGPAAVGGAETAGPSGPVDLNSASVDELETLPGVGPATAAAIVQHREAVGRFVTIDDLLAVPGIGPAKLEALRAAVRP